MHPESVILQLINALDQFRCECLPRTAREEAYSGWIAHFLMLEFGVRRVIVESHHDGRALASALRACLKPGCESWLPEAVGRGGAMNYDIVVARHDDVDARTFQTRFPDYARATIDERRREAARHLLQFSLCSAAQFLLGHVLIEIKLVDSAVDLVVTDMMVRDLIKLAATSAAIDEFCDESATPNVAFVVVVRGGSNESTRGLAFIRRLSDLAVSALDRMNGIKLPRIILVSQAAVETE